MKLSNFSRSLFGALDSGVGSAVALLEGIVMYYYSDSLGVSLEYIGLANFVIGVLAMYTALVVGNLSDRSQGTFRRKPYIFIFGPLWAVGLLFRMGAFTSKAAAPVYYALTYSIQVIGSTGINVTTSGWGCELAQDPVERSKLYSTATGVGFIGIFLGIALTVFPIQIGGVVGSVLVGTFALLVIIYLPDEVPLEKRTSYIPTVTNLHSLFWNTQFNWFILASMFVFFINTIPALYVFFLIYALGLGDSTARTYYTISSLGFVVCGLAMIPFVPMLLAYFGKVTCAHRLLLLVSVTLLGMLAASFAPAVTVILLFALLGGTSTLANITLNILGADIVDYDELLTGMKRAASYGSINNLVRLFITISGTSIPLALMSAFGFRSSSGNDDDDSSSTASATLVLRLWCTVFVAICFLLAYGCMQYYVLTESVHTNILKNISIRDGVYSNDDDDDDDGVENSICVAVDCEKGNYASHHGDDDDDDDNDDKVIAGAYNSDVHIGIITAAGSSHDDDPHQTANDGNTNLTVGKGLTNAASVAAPLEAEVAEGTNKSKMLNTHCENTAATVAITTPTAAQKQKLDSVNDPITGLPVRPPPFAQLLFICNEVFATAQQQEQQEMKKQPSSVPPSSSSSSSSSLSSPSSLTNDEMERINLLCCYFPTEIDVISTSRGRSVMLWMFLVKIVVGIIFLILGIWQSVYVLSQSKEYESYLFVLLTVVYSFFVAWQVLHIKGFSILYHMNTHQKQEEQEQQVEKDTSDTAAARMSDVLAEVCARMRKKQHAPRGNLDPQHMVGTGSNDDATGLNTISAAAAAAAAAAAGDTTGTGSIHDCEVNTPLLSSRGGGSSSSSGAGYFHHPEDSPVAVAVQYSSVQLVLMSSIQLFLIGVSWLLGYALVSLV